MILRIFVLASCGLAGLGVLNSAAADDPKSPTVVIRPFDQKDMVSFTTWLKKTGREDPLGVFQLNSGVLRCGDEDMGYVATKDAYQDFQLSVDYRWGRTNPNDKYVRNSGVLLNAVGPDGSERGVWMTSIECQLAQGCEGDLIVIKGKTVEGTPFPATISTTTIIAADGKTRWDKDGMMTVYSGKQFWWSNHQPFFKELIDSRGQDDVASPLGEWTKVECLCHGPKITIKINGVIVNECFDVTPVAGKVLLQTEGHEVFFRNLELRPLPIN
ncbi:MAG: DUF1080 domain-containing protein [Pirellulaceae bacterium]|nr:DUF1080 domain-containing protein [Pirellulaceae bacterium]